MESHSTPLPLQERLPQNNNPKRAIELLILSLLLLLLSHRLSLIGVHGAPWILAALCESWFAFIWALTVNAKWNPAVYRTFPENISKRFKDLPHLDVFVTTADASLEPPIITVDTVLSVLAVDYPPERLACYVSDDGCSGATYRALVEASEFARLWVPFCKRHGVRTRAPSVYFSAAEIGSDGGGSPEFLDEWRMMKKEYEELRQRIEQKINDFASFQCEEDAKDFSGIEVRNHPSIIKVIGENKQAGPDGIPHLIYVAREKSPKHPYHYKAGAMNVLTRVSAVMTNAPFMLNLDCDMFANNSKIMLHAMCLMLGFDNEVQSGFVQCPQQFHGALKDDPFGNQVVVLQQYIICGIAGIQGPPYGGTGCFHRRKVIYGVSPGHGDSGKENEKITKERFGHSRELMESATQTIKGTTKKEVGIYDLSSSLEAAKIVARSDYEFDTSWGKEMGWLYGSTAEDINTGVRIHANGWGSVRCTPDPPGFLGNAPVGGPESMTQLKRWATGLFEIIVGHNSPLIAVVTKKLRLRQCLAYMVINLWAARSLPELCYALLPAYCVLSGVAFLPKGPMVMVPITLFMIYNAHTLMEYLHCGLSPRAWWNNQRMQRVTSATAWLFGLLGVVLKLLGISETIFEITRKEQTSISDEKEIDGDAGRFTFDSSPLFVPATSIVLMNLVAIGVGLFRGGGGEGVGLGEVACCAWVVLCFWAFVRGMFGKGRYGIPWSTIGKAGVLCSLFLGLCMLG